MSALGQIKALVEEALAPLLDHRKEQDEKIADLQRRVAELESRVLPPAATQKSAAAAKKAAVPPVRKAQAGAAEAKGATGPEQK